MHTPEFSFEHDVGLVRQAVRDRQIDYPVAIDSDYEIWNAFDNRYWPALYFIDRDGIIRDEYLGEGRYDESERALQRLLGAMNRHPQVEAFGIEAGADWDDLQTPETYLGYARGSRFHSSGEVHFDQPWTYELPQRQESNSWALSGEWSIAGVVMNQATGGPIPFRVLLDGWPPG